MRSRISAAAVVILAAVLSACASASAVRNPHFTPGVGHTGPAVRAAEMAGPAQQAAGPMKKNPRQVGFKCPDHAVDDQHEVDIVDASTGVVTQTILIGDPPADPVTGEVVGNVNVQPVKFGTYYFVVRVVAQGLKSDNSLPSEQWQRAPGQATDVVVK